MSPDDRAVAMSPSDHRSPLVHHRTRRRWLGLAAAAAALGPVAWSGSGLLGATARAAGAPLTRRIPSTGEAVPAIGLGSWITFNVGNDAAARDACTDVVRAFFADGGRMIDSSPMYGSSQATIGHALAQIGRPATLFSAEKVWVGDIARGGTARLAGPHRLHRARTVCRHHSRKRRSASGHQRTGTD